MSEPPEEFISAIRAILGTPSARRSGASTAMIWQRLRESTTRGLHDKYVDQVPEYLTWMVDAGLLTMREKLRTDGVHRYMLKVEPQADFKVAVSVQEIESLYQEAAEITDASTQDSNHYYYARGVRHALGWVLGHGLSRQSLIRYEMNMVRQALEGRKP